MKRLFLFLGSLSWGERLHMLVLIITLWFYASYDIKKGNWPVTIGIIMVAWLIGWSLIPLMIAYPRQTYRIWNLWGIAFFVVYLLAHKQWWWRPMGAHYLRELYLWIDLSCGYWFISELRLQREKPNEDMLFQSREIDRRNDESRPDFRNDDFGDHRA